jgi:hypothetical protein
MSRATVQQRRNAIKRALAGESSTSIGVALGVPSATVRSWVKRAKAEDVFPADERVATLVPDLDTAQMSPMELLEHDIAATRRRLQLAEARGVFTAMAPLMALVRKMQTELESLRASQAEEVEDDDAVVMALLIDHMRVKTWVRGVLDDRQARTIVEAILQERTDT